MKTTQTHPNRFGGLDIKGQAGIVRTAFEDGTHVIYVFDGRMSLLYDVRIGYLAPAAVLNQALTSALTSTLGVRGEARDANMKALVAIRDHVFGEWKRVNEIK